MSGGGSTSLLWLVVALVSRAGSATSVSCTTSGAGDGYCERLTLDHWCRNGEGIGCVGDNSFGERDVPLSNYPCRGLSSGGMGSAGSRVTNITVVASPVGLSDTDFRVQWDFTMPQDGSITIEGYEVMVRNEDSFTGYACVTNPVKHVTLRNIYTRGADSITVLVRTLPYTASTLDNQTANVSIPLCNKCKIFAANRDLCTGTHVFYSVMDASTVSVSASLESSSDHMSVTISWPHVVSTAGLGVVVALADSANASKGTFCTTRGRNPPCFIVREARNVTIRSLSANSNYTLRLLRFNSSACANFNPTHLLDGYNGSCCNSNSRNIISPRFFNATTSTFPPRSLATLHHSHVTTSHDDHVTSSGHDSVHTSSTSPTDGDPMTSSFPPPPTPAQNSDYLVPIVIIASVGVVTITTAGVLILAFLVRRRCQPSKPSLTHTCTPPRLGLSKYLSPGHIITHDPHNSAYPLLNSSPSPLPAGEAKVLHFIESQSQSVGVPSPLTQSASYKQELTTHISPSCSTPSHSTALSPHYIASPPHPQLYPASTPHSSHYTTSPPHISHYIVSPPHPTTSTPHMSRYTASPPHPQYYTPQHYTAYTPATVHTSAISPHSSSATSHSSPATSHTSSKRGSGALINSVFSPQRPITLAVSQDSPQQPPTSHAPQENSALIIYSPSISEDKRALILEHLVGGLAQYGVASRCHDTECVKSPCEWMEEEIKMATAVLCVCNQDFHREWSQGPENGKIPVVGLLKHLVLAMVARGESLAKFATVLVEREDAQYIPSLYLEGEPRRFLVTELDDITRFIQNIPTYCTMQ